MFGIGVTELIIILVIALVIFGPGKLPKIGSALGKGISEFKKAASGNLTDDILGDGDDEGEKKKISEKKDASPKEDEAKA